MKMFWLIFLGLFSVSVWANTVCFKAFEPNSSQEPKNESSFESIQREWTPAQELTILAYQEALRSKSNSFLHIAPLSKNVNSITIHNLMERLTETTQKTKTGVTKGQKLALFVLNQAHSIESFIPIIGEKVLEYSEILDIEVFKWKTKETELSDLLSPYGASIVVMTSYQLKQILKDTESENYDLLKSHLSMTLFRFTSPVETELNTELILELKKHKQGFIYGVATEPGHQREGFKNLFQKIHWSYLNGKKSLFKDHVFPDPKDGILKQFEQGARSGELTNWSEPDFLDLPRKPNYPLFIIENELAVLHPSYYSVLASRLSGVFLSHPKGIILTGTAKSADSLTRFLNNFFPQMNFSNSSHRSQEEREDILRDLRTDKHHYIVSARSVPEIENLSFLSVYINLNTNADLVERLSLAGPVLNRHTEKSKSKIILLTDNKKEDFPETTPQTFYRDPVTPIEGEDLLKEDFQETKPQIFDQDPVTPITVPKKPTVNKTPPPLRSPSPSKTAVDQKTKKLPWEEALEKVQAAGLSSSRAYREWQRDHANMPFDPNRYYAPYWKNWDHFLGKEKLSWEEALEKARSAGLPGLRVYEEWQRDHVNMPFHPDRHYAKHWKSWAHFLGKENQKLPWNEALEKTRSAGLANYRAYQQWQKDHSDMPAHPDRYYAEDWKGWDHFLGRKTNIKLTWNEALQKVQAAGLTNYRAYQNWQKDHANMPFNPKKHYVKHWKGWDHFLGKENQKLPWNEALQKVRSAHLSSVQDYMKWRKDHPNMPSHPERHYAKYWKGWSYFLKGEKKAQKLPWLKALDKVRSAKLHSIQDYLNWQKNHANMPSHPEIHYAKHWKSWAHFLGRKNQKLPWNEALQKVRSAGLPNFRAYQKWQINHLDMPVRPDSYKPYASYWKGWNHFLGKKPPLKAF